MPVSYSIILKNSLNSFVRNFYYRINLFHDNGEFLFDQFLHQFKSRCIIGEQEKAL